MSVHEPSEAAQYDVSFFPEIDPVALYIFCNIPGYDALWNKLKQDPMLADQLSSVQLKHPSIDIFPISDPSEQRWSFREVFTTALLTILLYFLLAVIIYTIFLGLNTLLKWITG